jgi:hypothetical protein
VETEIGLVWLVVSKWLLLGCGSVAVRLRDAIEVAIFKEMRLLPIYLNT